MPILSQVRARTTRRIRESVRTGRSNRHILPAVPGFGCHLNFAVFNKRSTHAVFASDSGTSGGGGPL